MTTKPCVLIFGGAFNPPTLAHEAIIAACLGLPQFDAVWLMPSGSRVDKHIAGDDADRLAMLRTVRHASFHDDPRLKVSDFELRLPRPNATYKTVHALQANYPNTTFWFALGRDSYISMPEWPEGAWLRQHLAVVVFTSGAGEAITAPDVLVLDIGDAYEQTASTHVRQDAARAHLHVSPAVLEYIRQHKLYQTSDR